MTTISVLLSVFMLVLPRTSPAFLPGLSRMSEHREARFRGGLAMSKRNMDEETAQQLLETEFDLHCPGTACTFNGQVMRALNLLIRLEFRELTTHLVAECPMGLAGLVAACEESTCPSPHMMLNVRYVASVLQWACSHKEQFQTSIGCWNHEFANQMNQCFGQPPSGQSSYHDQIIHCFEDRLSQVPNCSAQAQNLFINLMQMTRDS